MVCPEGNSDLSVPYDHSEHRMRKAFRAVGLDQGWWDTELPMVLAVSGGSDSMAMLWMFRRLWRGSVVVAHLDHQLRGDEARDDARFVREMAAHFDVPVHIEALPVTSLLRKGESFEDGARRIRYDFLERVRASSGGWGIAVAHTADDDAETFLLNLFRGSGPRGLAGIPERRGVIVRPLLTFSRTFLRKTLEHHHIPWREDRSNEDDTYLRNRVRNRLIPLLRKEYNPRAQEHILGATRYMKTIRKQEERTWPLIVALGRRRIPGTRYAATRSFLGDLDDETLATLLRGVGQDLGLSTLSRERMARLVALVRQSSGWCFQWQREMSVFSASDLVSWVNPAILDQAGRNTVRIPLTGASGATRWGEWFFSWERVISPDFFLGAMQALLPTDGWLEIRPSTEEERSVVPPWGFSFFPTLLSGGLRWAPFWQSRGRPGARSAGRGAVRILASCDYDTGRLD